MAGTLEESAFTSIKERIQPEFDLAAAVHQQLAAESLRYFDLPLKPLGKFDGDLKLGEQLGILFGAVDYLQLVDVTGRIICEGKRGHISEKLPPILDRLNLDVEAWLIRTQSFERHYQQLFSKYAIRSNLAA